MKYNHYLDELGFCEEEWMYDNQNSPDHRYRQNDEGFIPAMFYDLDVSLGMIIYSHLRYFKDNCLHSHPSGMTMEEWQSIVDKMIDAFKGMVVEDEYRMSKRRKRALKQGLRLFIKYYQHLWY